MRIVVATLVTVLLSVPRISAAQAPTTVAPPQLPRFYVDVNLLGYADPLGQSKTFENYALTFGEVATFKASYPEPSGGFPAYVGGGFMLHRSIGIGVSYSRISRDTVVGLFAEVPDPEFFDALASGTGTTGTALSRTESAIHVSLAFVPVRSSRWEFRMIGGPSLFRLTGDMVKDVGYEQTFSTLAPQNVITIDGFSSREASGSGIGFHAGVDLTYFVHRVVGVSGGVRYGQGLVKETEPLSGLTQQFQVGGTTVFLGLHFRLGRVPR